MKKLFFYLAIFSLFTCKKDSDGTRTFFMGVTPWPYDFTEDGKSQAQNFVKNHCDLISQHFDEGIPWQEAWDNAPWPQKLQKDLDERLNRTKNRDFMVTPLSIGSHP